MLTRLAELLSEAVMGFLALAALSCGLAPLLFALPGSVERSLDALLWVVVALYALEYAVNFARAADKRGFALDPWRILDLIIVVAALLSLLPAIADAARYAPALRLLQLLRILLFGPRIGHGLAHPPAAPQRPPPDGAPRVTVLRPGDPAPCPGSWDALLQWVAAPSQQWVHASNLAPERLAEVASAAGVAPVLIEAALHDSSYPRIEAGARWAALTVSLPTLDETMERDPLLVLMSASGALSLTAHALDLQQAPLNAPLNAALHAPLLAAGPAWGLSCALHIIGLVLDRNERFAGRAERSVRLLEQLPAGDNSEDFLRRSFRLKRVLSTAKADLWRLHGLLEMLGDGRRTLPGLTPELRDSLTELAEHADYLYETVDNVREALLSLIELHIDLSSHQTNRFMRLLAIVSTLALIPAVAGGLLGMNLAEGPWPVTLGQIAFGTAVLALAVLYTFMAKGWLR